VKKEEKVILVQAKGDPFLAKKNGRKGWESSERKKKSVGTGSRATNPEGDYVEGKFLLKNERGKGGGYCVQMNPRGFKKKKLWGGSEKKARPSPGKSRDQRQSHQVKGESRKQPGKAQGTARKEKKKKKKK